MSIFSNTLGVAQYRCGLMSRGAGDPDTVKRPEQAERTLPTWPSWLWPSTAWGNPIEARDDLGSAARSDEGSAAGRECEATAFLREAETIELDRVFPADPFAR